MGDQLAELRKRSNENERRLNQQVDQIQAKIDHLDRESAKRVDEVDDRIQEEARRALAERTTEGILLAIGIALQVVGAAAGLLNWSPIGG